MAVEADMVVAVADSAVVVAVWNAIVSHTMPKQADFTLQASPRPPRKSATIMV